MSLAAILVLTVLPLVAVIAAYLVSRVVFKLIMTVVSLVFVVLLVVGGYVLYDAYGFTHELNAGPTRFVLPDGSAGFATVNGTRVPLNETALNETTNGTTFTVPLSFVNRNATASYLDTNVTYEAAVSAMHANDPATSFADALAAGSANKTGMAAVLRADFVTHYPTATEQRGYIYSELVSSTLGLEGESALILAIHNGTITVTPNRPVIRFIRYLPTSITKEALSVQVQ